MQFQVQPQVRSKVRSLMNVAPHGVDLLLSLELDLVGSAVRLLVTVVLYQKIRWDPICYLPESLLLEETDWSALMLALPV